MTFQVILYNPKINIYRFFDVGQMFICQHTIILSSIKHPEKFILNETEKEKQYKLARSITYICLFFNRFLTPL